MKIIFIITFFAVAIGFVGGMGYLLFKNKVIPTKPLDQVQKTNNTVKLIDFYKINPEFLFSAKIPNEFEIEYLPKVRAINVYDPSMSGKSNVEESQMYITFFKADRFLTLNTVEITQQDKISINSKDATLYEITKKETVPNFSGQPIWRNVKHKAIDIRYSKDNPSYFYSFAQNPNLSQKVFDEFINSLIFINN